MPRRLWLGLAWAALVLALLGGTLAVSPAARATVARWFSPFHGIVIFFAPARPTSTPTALVVTLTPTRTILTPAPTRTVFTVTPTATVTTGVPAPTTTSITPLATATSLASGPGATPTPSARPTRPTVPALTVTPVPPGRSLGLGRLTTLAGARAHVHYAVVTPHLAGLGAPDAVYLRDLAQSRMVSLVYRPRPGFPAAVGSRVGLLLTEFRGDVGVEPFSFAKNMEPGARLERVTVAGAAAYWLTGRPHDFWFAAPGGAVGPEPVRLAGHVLLWERKGLVLRLEAAIDKETALRVAASVR